MNRSYRYGMGKPSFYAATLTFEDGSCMWDFVQEWSSRIAFARLAKKGGKVSNFHSQDTFTEQEWAEVRGDERAFLISNPVRDWSALDLY